MITHEAQQKGAQVLKDRADERARYVLQLVTDGRSQAEIAEEFGIHPGSVRTILHRSRQRLGLTAPGKRYKAPLSEGEYYVDPDARSAYEAS
jgi:DNA-directed RNA polymerase specialized sigma24 family protein